jgi:hypothetical protein
MGTRCDGLLVGEVIWMGSWVIFGLATGGKGMGTCVEFSERNGKITGFVARGGGILGGETCAEWYFE